MVELQLGMFIKILFVSLMVYFAFKLIVAFFKGVFVIKQIKKQQSAGDQNQHKAFLNRSSGREKDISDRARILDEDKNAE